MVVKQSSRSRFESLLCYTIHLLGEYANHERVVDRAYEMHH